MRYTQDEDRAIMIVNDGFLTVFKKLDKYSGKGSLKAWIRRIVFNALSDHFRKENRYLKFIIFEEKDEVKTETALDNIYYEELLSMVDTLQETTRIVFTKYAIEGYSHKEIAAYLDMSEGNSKWHLHKARTKLKEMINRKTKERNHAS